MNKRQRKKALTKAARNFQKVLRLVLKAAGPTWMPNMNMRFYSEEYELPIEIEEAFTDGHA